jgi:hypothetical protein
MNYEPDNSNWRQNKATYDESEIIETEKSAKPNVDLVKWIQLGNIIITPVVIFSLGVFEVISTETTEFAVFVWLISIAALFFLIPVYQKLLYGTTSETSIDHEVIGNGVMTAASFIVIGVFLRVIYGCYEWLKNGYWETLTLCKEFRLMCFGDTDFVGLNKIISEIGTSDFFFVGIGLALLCSLFGYFYKS